MNKKNLFSVMLILIFIGTISCSDDSTQDPLPEKPGTQTKEDTSIYNVLDFGADNTGKDDCSKAFSAIIEEINAKEVKHVDIYLPPGKYRISKRVVFDASSFVGYKVNSGLIFRGAGEDVTELVCDNEEGGFFFNVNTNMITVTVRDLSFVAAKEGKGTAIEFNTDDKNAGSHRSRMFQVQHVLIRGQRYDNGHFLNGILCYNAWYPYIDNVKVAPRYGPDSEKYRMDTGILFEDCYSPLVTNSYVWGYASYGLLYKGVKTPPEDGIVKDSYFVNVDNGIYVDLTTYDKWSEPAFHVQNCHINYWKNGVYLKGIRQAFIGNNLFYCQNRAGSTYLGNTNPQPAYTSVDINCDYASDLIISNNQFTEPASPKRIAIDISSRSGGVLIEANTFNLEGTGIRNQSQQTSYAIGNVFEGVPDFTQHTIVPYVDIKGTLKRIDFE